VNACHPRPTPFPAFVVLSALVAACAARQGVAPAVKREAAGAPEASRGRRQTVAVFPFDNNAVAERRRLDFLRDFLPDAIAARLGEEGALRVVERRELVKILAEQKLGASDLASQEGRIRLGRIAGAQTMVFGDFSAMADILQMDARVVDVESGAILESASVQGGASDTRRLAEQLCDQVASDLGLKIERAALAAGLGDSRDLRGAELYYAGVALERNGQTAEAIESYRRALEINRDDAEARNRLRRLLGEAP
jgi:TolB-like protein